MNSQEKARLLLQIENEIKICKKCGLCETATNSVPGHGNQDCKIMIIGEAPGAKEDLMGLPFIGRAGKLLDSMLAEININRSEVWIGNIIKHRPPKNRDPLPNELAACSPFLTKQIEIINPLLIVTLGRFSMNYFLPNSKISEAHGNPHQIKNYNVYPVYHPAAALRNQKMKNTLLQDFLKIPAIIKEIEGTNLVS